MPKKLQSDDDDLMKIFEHYAELRREHTEYQETSAYARMRHRELARPGRSARRTQRTTHRQRDQFLERYYRLVTQFELMGGSFDRARAGITNSIGYLRGQPEKRELHEIPALPVAKSLGNGSGKGLENGNGLENGIAKLAAALEDERQQERK